eukprot:Seg1365.9 transcript_id=Seg1365.9/GoldUCD/mRNA.D3Y31 product="hypothetical protein" protein_id=Seg1365.9/GoldUCD/D3Y31
MILALEWIYACMNHYGKTTYLKSSGGISSEYKKEYFTKFEPLANVMVGKMQEHLYFMPNPRPSLKEYFKRSGLVTLFPKSASYIINHRRPAFKNQKSTMDGYFTHLSMVNQLLCLGNQLNSDVNNLDNHKYIAHQIALLYQAINQVGPSLNHLKEQIEENFIKIKESLSSQDKASSLKLPRTHKDWVNSITGDLLNSLMSLHLPIMQPLQPAVQFLRQCSQSCH